MGGIPFVNALGGSLRTAGDGTLRKGLSSDCAFSEALMGILLPGEESTGAAPGQEPATAVGGLQEGSAGTLPLELAPGEFPDEVDLLSRPARGRGEGSTEVTAFPAGRMNRLREALMDLRSDKSPEAVCRDIEEADPETKDSVPMPEGCVQAFFVPQPNPVEETGVNPASEVSEALRPAPEGSFLNGPVVAAEGNVPVAPAGEAAPGSPVEEAAPKGQNAASSADGELLFTVEDLFFTPSKRHSEPVEESPGKTEAGAVPCERNAPQGNLRIEKLPVPALTHPVEAGPKGGTEKDLPAGEPPEPGESPSVSRANPLGAGPKTGENGSRRGKEPEKALVRGEVRELPLPSSGERKRPVRPERDVFPTEAFASAAESPSGPALLQGRIRPGTAWGQALERGVFEMAVFLSGSGKSRQRGILRLRPPELGEIRVVLLSAGERVRLHLTVESPEVGEAVRNSEENLREGMRRQGLVLKEMTVDVGDGSGRGFGQSFSGRDERRFSLPLENPEEGSAEGKREEAVARLDLISGVFAWVA
ncbi:MAG: flagellar hook-length control protein FliK [Synergistales bacterium]